MLSKVKAIFKRKSEPEPESEPIPEHIFNAAMESTNTEFLQSVATALMTTEGDSARYWDIKNRIWWLEHE